MSDVPRRLTSAEQLALLNAIADRWGSPGCSRSFDGETWRFVDEGPGWRLHYEVDLPGPGADYVVLDGQGREQGRVRCDGLFVTLAGEEVDLLAGGPR